MDQNNSQIQNLENTIIKKTWEIPAIVEISKFEILGNRGNGNDGNNPSGNNSLT